MLDEYGDETIEAAFEAFSRRAEALMREHANSVKESINLAALPVSGAESAGRLLARAPSLNL